MTESGTLGERRKSYVISLQKAKERKHSKGMWANPGDTLLYFSVGTGETPGEKATVEAEIKTGAEVDMSKMAGPDFIREIEGGYRVGSETAEPYRASDLVLIRGRWSSIKLMATDPTEPIEVFRYDEKIGELTLGESMTLRPPILERPMVRNALIGGGVVAVIAGVGYGIGKALDWW